MTVTNDFLQFAQTDTGTNLEEQATYLADPNRMVGNIPGVAISQFVNKALRQSTAISAALAQYLANNTGMNMIDDGEIDSIIAALQVADAGQIADVIQNLSLTATVASSALTVNFLTSSGAAPTTTTPIYLGFRSATLATGSFNLRSVTSSISLTVPSEATLGLPSGYTGILYIYMIDNVGTVEAAISLTRFSENQLVTTTAIASGSSAGVMYSTTARSSVPIRLVGQLTITETTAGTWATAPTQIQLAPFSNIPQQPLIVFPAAKTANYSVQLSDSMLFGDGTSGGFSFNLPPLSSCSGKTFTFQRADSTFGNFILLSPFSGDSFIGGATLSTSGETISILNTGSAWIITNHYVPEALITYTPTFVGLGTVTVDFWTSYRQGRELVITGEILIGTPASSTVVSFGLPTGLLAPNIGFIPMGSAINSTTFSAALYAIPISNSSTIQFGFSNGASGGSFNGATGSQFTASTLLSIYLRIPIFGWSA